MKLPSVFSLVCVSLTVLCVLISTVEAGRKKDRKKIKQCVYKRKGERGECSQVTGNLEVVYKLKASRQRFDCAPTKIKIKKCPGCKYLKQSAEFGECQEDGRMTKMAPLDPVSPEGCPPARLITRKCRGGKAKNKDRSGGRRRGGRGRRGGKGKDRRNRANRGNKGRRGGGGKGRGRGRGGRGKKRGGMGCVYKNKDWSECDETTNTRQRQRELVSGDPKSCLPKKIVTKKCRKACRYVRGEWSECDDETKSMNRTLEPKPGSLPECEGKVQTRPCFMGADIKRGRPTKCRYKFGAWSECDHRTNTMTREMVLRKGDPNLCKRTVELTRKCKLACKFKRGEWSECDKMTRLMKRVDVLTKGSPAECEKERTITKKCRKSKCKYVMGPWSECSEDTNARSRTKTLSKGDADKCRAEIVISKACVDKNGEARCFFGSWGEFGPCTNGVMTKQRVLLQGGVECERRAVVAKACDD